VPSSPATPLRLNAGGIDLTPRVQHTATVAASPATNAETTIASLTISGNLATGLGVLLVGFAAFTVGTSGVSVNLKLRQTDTSGTTIKATGAITYTAADLGSLTIVGLDASPTLPGQVYVLTMTVASGAAASTVSAVSLVALVV
jgi:hypothetical protein